MSEPAIDVATYDALKETTGAEFAVELVDTFLEEAPRMLETLRQSLARDDADAFRRAAHSLKSNSNTFGALALGRMARELELSGADAVKLAGTAPLTSLEREYARVVDALKSLRDG
jgi:HPt (histidine-containing phosphotransfer) domain-containing protein